MRILDSLYCKIRRKEIEKAITRVEKLKTSTFLQGLTRECWKNNIQYNIIYKNSEALMISVIGRKKNVLIKYHRINKVSLKYLEEFVTNMEQYESNKGIYISTGCFEHECKEVRNVALIDCHKFIKDQLGAYGKTKDVFESKKLKFYLYLPD